MKMFKLSLCVNSLDRRSLFCGQRVYVPSNKDVTNSLPKALPMPPFLQGILRIWNISLQTQKKQRQQTHLDFFNVLHEYGVVEPRFKYPRSEQKVLPPGRGSSEFQGETWRIMGHWIASKSLMHLPASRACTVPALWELNISYEISRISSPLRPITKNQCATWNARQI